jgi:integrase
MTSPTNLPNQDHPRLDSLSLFDAKEVWRTEPMVAFQGLVVSDDYRATNRSSMALEMDRNMRDNSAKVYTSMFGKFMRHLTGRSRTLLDTTHADVADFFGAVLGESSSETRARYARLTERVFEHLMASEFVAFNPVSTWVRANGGTDSRDIASAVPNNLVVTAGTVARLQDWMYTRGCAAIDIGDWKLARDLTLASLSLGTGLRCAELLRLHMSQVAYKKDTAAADRFQFEIPGWASADSVRAHRTPAGRNCADLLERWWNSRWEGFGSALAIELGGNQCRAPIGLLVFPSTLSGKPLTPSPLYRNLREHTDECVLAGILDDSNRWVLERGAQGLRRAFILTSLESGVDPELLTERLGHSDRRSIRRYGPNAQRGVMPQFLPEI